MAKAVFAGRKRHAPLRPAMIALKKLSMRVNEANIRSYPQVAIFSFDHIGTAINIDGRYERDTLELVADFLDAFDPGLREKVALDIGANIGNHSLFFAGYFQHVFAFEPHPLTFGLLTFNTAKRNVTPLGFGLSAAAETLRFEIDPTNVGGSRIIGAGDEANPQNVIAVSVKRLDDVEEIKDASIALIKIDIEGHELSALQGATDTITRTRPIILFEQGSDEIRDGTSDVIEFLRDSGYSFLVIQNRYQIGSGLVSKVLSLCLRTLLGFQKTVTETERFDAAYYDMIIAVPKDRLTAWKGAR